MNKKALGVGLMLLALVALTSLVQPSFLEPVNLQNLARWIGLYGILSVGMAFVLLTGGVDLSVGSIVGLSGCVLFLWIQAGVSEVLAVAGVLALGTLLGVVHGLLITGLRLQPFVVTLCGLFFYRGFARYLADDEALGLPREEHPGLFRLVESSPWTLGMPGPFVILVVTAVLAAVLLNLTVPGRWLRALGDNEQAARYSGIPTGRMTVLAYALSGLSAGLAGILFALHVSTVQPSVHGNFYELYAIAGAVLGGCSLRGGEASILGVVFGAALVRVLYNAINLLRIPTQLEYAVIGGIILAGVIADELLRRQALRRSLRHGPGG